MKDALLTLALAVAIFLGFVAQEFIPPIEIAKGARVLLAPVFFCFGACTLPFPAMLALALLTGFLSDFTALQIVHRSVEASDLDTLQSLAGAVELSAGWSILFFVAFGLICQGLRPLVLRGHWWLPPLMSAVTTIAYLALQFAMLTMRRFDTGGLFWSDAVMWRILAPGAIALVLTLALVLASALGANHWIDERRSVRDF
ncbi:MAG: hypothetical protein PHC88_07715 [Terrimicrobiaceae bacterium]|nr:hypothetical protein [Terrimicrobiaceae bacterium]